MRSRAGAAASVGVAVVGGSIAGCAAARAAGRGGAEEAVVYERAACRLEDRGVGLAIHDTAAFDAWWAHARGAGGFGGHALRMTPRT